MMVSMVGQDSVHVVDVETSVVPNVGDEVAYSNRLYMVVGRRVKHSPGDAGGFGPRPLPLSATKGERRRCSPC